MSKKSSAAADAAEDAKAAASDDGAALEGRTATDVAFVEALARILKEHDLAEVEVTREYGDDDELTVRLSKAVAHAPALVAAAPAPAPQLAPPAAHEAPAASDAAHQDPTDHPGCVISPMVGTVYLSPEPGAPNFIQTGEAVEAGQTLLIVEAMKTMNQIPAPKAGIVRQIFVGNEQPVEYGAPLVIVE